MPDHVGDIATLKAEVRHVAEAVERLEDKLDALTARANKGSVAFFSIIGLGGLVLSVITWILSRAGH